MALYSEVDCDRNDLVDGLVPCLADWLPGDNFPTRRWYTLDLRHPATKRGGMVAEMIRAGMEETRAGQQDLLW